MHICSGLFAIVFLALGTGWLPVATADQILSVQEIEELFSGKTAEGVVAGWGIPFKGFYAADGSFRGKTRHGHWKVTADARHCVKYGKKGWSCGVLVATGDGSYKKIRMTGGPSGEKKHLVTFHKFNEGNPEGF